MRERATEKHQFVFHLFMHSLADPCTCPDWGSNPQPWCCRDNAYQLSYLAGATTAVLTQKNATVAQCT